MLLYSELPLECWEAVAACLPHFHAMVGEGQEGQSPLGRYSQEDRSMRPVSFAADAPTTRGSAFHWHPAATWAQNVKKFSSDIDLLYGWEQRRYGARAVALVHAVFPEYRDLRCAMEQAETLVRPNSDLCQPIFGPRRMGAARFFTQGPSGTRLLLCWQWRWRRCRGRIGSNASFLG